MNKKNLLNKRFGSLVVIEETDKRKNKKILWKCLCDCGEICVIRGDSLKNGNTKSCGCIVKENCRQNIGKKFTKEHIRNISNSLKGRFISEKTKKKISKANSGKNHPLWKGGYNSKNIPLYDTYAHQISYAEQVRRNKEDRNILEVKCTYCGKWYIPTLVSIKSRINALNGIFSGENRLYCSNECKQECPVYWKQKYSSEETNTKQYSREVQPELRQMVFERDNWTCQKCNSEINLHCHHITGVELNPIESADVDNCITLCKICHKDVHKQDGCKRSDYRRKKCYGTNT